MRSRGLFLESDPVNLAVDTDEALLGDGPKQVERVQNLCCQAPEFVADTSSLTRGLSAAAVPTRSNFADALGRSGEATAMPRTLASASNVFEVVAVPA